MPSLALVAFKLLLGWVIDLARQYFIEKGLKKVKDIILNPDRKATAAAVTAWFKS